VNKMLPNNYTELQDEVIRIYERLEHVEALIAEQKEFISC